MSTQHTPGPWTARRRQVFEDHGMVIAEMVSLGGDTPDSRSASLREAEANARLIAAAPAMRAVLEMANLPFSKHSAGYAVVDLADITKLRDAARALLARLDGCTCAEYPDSRDVHCPVHPTGGLG